MARKHTGLRRFCAALLALALLPVGVWAAEPEKDPKEQPVLGIYTTGDMAGRVGETDPLTGSPEAYSYTKVATAMARERETMADTLLLDSGDAVSNTLVSGGAADTALALRTIGYDALVPGVEEFRLGQGRRTAFFQALTGTEGAGTPVEVLSADWLDGENGQPAAKPYQIFTRQMGDEELRIAVVGLGTLAVPNALPFYYYSDSQFGQKNNTAGSYAVEWRYWQARVAREDCDLVVVSCHTDQRTLRALGAATSGIDLLVGGHGPADAGTLNNAEGKLVSWVCSGGTALTRTTVTISEGEPVVGSSELLDLSSYAGDAALTEATAAGQTALEQQALRRAGTLSGDWSEYETASARQSAAADLVARAMLWTSGADAALVTHGSLGSLPEVAGTGNRARTVTFRDCALLARGSSPVVVVELTGAQLEQWLNVCAGRYTIGADGQITGGEGADFLYGMDYTLYLGAQNGRRVTGLRWKGGAVEGDRVFRVALEESHLRDPEFPTCTVLWSAAADMQYAGTRGTMAAMLAAYVGRSGTIRPERASTWAVYQGVVNSPLTRLEFVELLYEAAGRPVPGADAAFLDIAGSDAVIWAAETRIVSGDGKGNFLPGSKVTREQAASMLYNYAQAAGIDVTADQGAVDRLSDGVKISAWARPAVAFCLERELLRPSGGAAGQFRPAATLTRTELQSTIRTLSRMG